MIILKYIVVKSDISTFYTKIILKLRFNIAPLSIGFNIYLIHLKPLYYYFFLPKEVK
jgi:hypothetical protein